MNYMEFRNQMMVFPSFSIREIEKHFPGFDSRRLVEWQQKGYIRKLRNGYYCFSDKQVSESFLYFTANELYSPSYVSLETALSEYGFIPEGVFQITSCSTRKTHYFETPVGGFTYRHIKPALFFGYTLVKWKEYHYAIAEPEKVLIDYLYLHPEVLDMKEFEALRWNSAAINEEISMEKLTNYEAYIGSAALSHRLSLLKNYLNASTE